MTADWRTRAACRGAGDMWLLRCVRGRMRPAQLTGAAIEICMGCPVFNDCHTWITGVIAETGDDPCPSHVVAGLTPEQRQQQPRPARDVSPTRVRCGTPSGYTTHCGRGEAPCWDCRQAQAAYHAAWRQKRRYGAA
jgi:hypothetical protein